MSTDLRIDKQQIKIPGMCILVVYGSTSLGFIFLANLPACFALPLSAQREGAQCSLDFVSTPLQHLLNHGYCWLAMSKCLTSKE